MKRKVKFRTGWLGLLSLVAVIIGAGYIMFYPRTAFAEGTASMAGNVAVLKGTLDYSTGQPVAGATIQVEVKETVNGKTVYKPWIKLKTTDKGVFWGKFRIPNDGKVLVLEILGSHHTTEYVTLNKGHVTTFHEKVTKGFNVAGFQTFAY